MSAPCSPNWPRRAKVGSQRGLPDVGTIFSSWDMSQLHMEPVGDKILEQVGDTLELASPVILEPASPVSGILEPVSQVGDNILEPNSASVKSVEHENADSAVGSCVAEGDMSDVISSADMEEEEASDDLKEESNDFDGADMVWRREQSDISTEYQKYVTAV